MTSPQPYRGVINAENPRSHIQRTPNEPQRSLQDIEEENQRLRLMIEKIKKQK